VTTLFPSPGWNLREHDPDQRLDEHREAVPLIGGDASEPVFSAGFDPGLGSNLGSFVLAREALQVMVRHVLDPRNPGASGEFEGATEKVSGLIEMAVVQKRLGGIERDLRAGS
jgi:hypothetical protein